MQPLPDVIPSSIYIYVLCCVCMCVCVFGRYMHVCMYVFMYLHRDLGLGRVSSLEGTEEKLKLIIMKFISVLLTWQRVGEHPPPPYTAF